MRAYLSNPGFWFAVLVSAFIINFVWNYFTKKGKLI